MWRGGSSFLNSTGPSAWPWARRSNGIAHAWTQGAPAGRRARSGVRVAINSEGIRTPAGRAQWISSPSP